MPEGDVVGKGEVIETTVSEVAAELTRRGLGRRPYVRRAEILI